MAHLRTVILGILITVALTACGADIRSEPRAPTAGAAASQASAPDGSLWVHVKYRSGGPVDVAGFAHHRPLDPPVNEAWYDASNQYMIVNLEGTNYHYCRFTRGDWADLVNASNAGSYYQGQIRGSFDCRGGGVPSYEVSSTASAATTPPQVPRTTTTLAVTASTALQPCIDKGVLAWTMVRNDAFLRAMSVLGDVDFDGFELILDREIFESWCLDEWGGYLDATASEVRQRIGGFHADEFAQGLTDAQLTTQLGRLCTYLDLMGEGDDLLYWVWDSRQQLSGFSIWTFLDAVGASVFLNVTYDAALVACPRHADLLDRWLSVH